MRAPHQNWHTHNQIAPINQGGCCKRNGTPPLPFLRFALSRVGLGAKFSRHPHHHHHYTRRRAVVRAGARCSSSQQAMAGADTPHAAYLYTPAGQEKHLGRPPKKACPSLKSSPLYSPLFPLFFRAVSVLLCHGLLGEGEM